MFYKLKLWATKTNFTLTKHTCHLWKMICNKIITKQYIFTCIQNFETQIRNNVNSFGQISSGDIIPLYLRLLELTIYYFVYNITNLSNLIKIVSIVSYIKFISKKQVKPSTVIVI